MVDLIGNIALGYVLPVLVILIIILVYLKTKQRNIAYNSIGFLLLTLSIAMSGAPGFADQSIPNNIILTDIYKFFGVIFGLVGTAICAVVAFKDQAVSSNKS